MIIPVYLEYSIEHSVAYHPHARMCLYSFAGLQDAAGIMENIKNDILKSSVTPGEMQLRVCKNRFVSSYEAFQFSCKSIDCIIQWLRKCSDRYKIYIETLYEYRSDWSARATSNIKKYSGNHQGRYISRTDSYWPYPVIKKIYMAPVMKQMNEKFVKDSMHPRNSLNNYAGISHLAKTRAYQFRPIDIQIFGNDYNVQDVIEWDIVLQDFIGTCISASVHDSDKLSNILSKYSKDFNRTDARFDVRDMINNSFSYQCISNDINGLIPITADIICNVGQRSELPSIPAIFKYMPSGLSIGEMLQNNLFFRNSKDILLFYDDYKGHFSKYFNLLF